MDSITVNDKTYEIERSTDRHNGDVVLTIEEFPGLEGRMGFDEFAQDHSNPRDWSNVGTMAVSYRRYELGDENISKIDFDVDCGNCDGEGTVAGNPDEDCFSNEVTCGICAGNGYYTRNPVDYFKQERGARVVLPLSVYEHSGITMFVGHKDYMFDPGGWDTSYVGFIFDTPEGVKQCIGDNVTDAEIEAALESEVKVYASYLEGDVTQYMVEDEETNFYEGCGGYVGDSDQCERECFVALESAIKARLNEQTERAHWAARDTITK